MRVSLTNTRIDLAAVDPTMGGGESDLITNDNNDKPAVAWEPPAEMVLLPTTKTKEVALEYCKEFVSNLDHLSAPMKSMAAKLAVRWPLARPFDTVPNFARAGYMRSLLRQISEPQAVVPCDFCRDRKGRWAVCVASVGEGACSSCSWSTDTTRCNYHSKSFDILKTFRVIY